MAIKRASDEAIKKVGENIDKLLAGKLPSRKKGMTKEKFKKLPKSMKKKIEKFNEAYYSKEGKEVVKISDGSYRIKDKLKKLIINYFGKKDLAKQILEVQPMYYDKARLWWAWSRKELFWEIIDETDVMNMVDTLAVVNTVQAKEKSEILEALRQEARKNKPKEVKPTWIQFKDTIYDVLTGDGFEATSKYFVTNPIPYALHKEKYIETPHMDKIFKEWVGEDYVKTLYEIIAYCLLPSYPIHRLFCFIGEGMNGKSCFLRLLEKFVGLKNVTATELDTLMTSRFELTRLHKKLVCIMGETNFSELRKTSTIKKLTGQDMIGFEYKNKNLFEGANYAKILIATNNLPTTTDKTLGFYRRWCIIDFPNRFTEEKEILDDIPEEEYECLTLKSAFILKDLLKNRRFTNEGSIEDRMDKYESKSDFLQKFLDEFIRESSEGYIIKTDFKKKFDEWCKENRHRTMAHNTLGKKLKEKEFADTQKYFDWLHDGKGGQLRCWAGICWK